MNVSLTPELEKFVSAKVGSGRYNSASEVVREALRLLEEHDSARAAQLADVSPPWIAARPLTRIAADEMDAADHWIENFSMRSRPSGRLQASGTDAKI